MNNDPLAAREVFPSATKGRLYTRAYRRCADRGAPAPRVARARCFRMPVAKPSGAAGSSSRAIIHRHDNDPDRDRAQSDWRGYRRCLGRGRMPNRTESRALHAGKPGGPRRIFACRNRVCFRSRGGFGDPSRPTSPEGPSPASRPPQSAAHLTPATTRSATRARPVLSASVRTKLALSVGSAGIDEPIQFGV